MKRPDNFALCAGNGQLHQFNMTHITNTLDCMHDQQIVMVKDCYGLQNRLRIPGYFRGADGQFPSGFVYRSGRVQQYVPGFSEFIGGGGIAATLDSSYYKGTGSRNGKEREFIVIIPKEKITCQKNDTASGA